VDAEFVVTRTVEPGYGGTFRVGVGRVAPVAGPLRDTFADETLAPRGRFVVLELTLTNLGADPARLWDASGFRLRDGRGRRFSPDPAASRALAWERGAVTYVFQPGLPYPALLVWDVSPDAAFTLEVEGTDVAVPLAWRA
jgi:hypothetical protein